jgi:hypothetical protein
VLGMPSHVQRRDRNHTMIQRVTAHSEAGCRRT